MVFVVVEHYRNFKNNINNPVFRTSTFFGDLATIAIVGFVVIISLDEFFGCKATEFYVYLTEALNALKKMKKEKTNETPEWLKNDFQNCEIKSLMKTQWTKKAETHGFSCTDTLEDCLFTEEETFSNAPNNKKAEDFFWNSNEETEKRSYSFSSHPDHPSL